MAVDGTHHVLGGVALYSSRFLEVLKFHEPGLAPVRDVSGAYHIDPTGSPAYSSRYARTFGFYEGHAAVSTDDGWFHVQPDGTVAYAERYAWCGNYQGGRCTVRGRDGRYLHLDDAGRVAYEARWRYAGDYRDGIAVVQRDDGLHTHIDHNGRPTHGRWFLDLDVFHKGFARARVEDGWTHVDDAGRPVHARRSAMVEPFYNGQARVERPDGGLEIIDEQGATVIELRPARRDELAELSGGWCIPPSVLRWLSEMPTERHVALLLRHSVRPPFEPGDDGYALPLTAEGRALARDLGQRLGPRLATLHTSPLLRCVQTAEALREGAAVPCDVVPDRLLGDPGVYVIDDRLAKRTWLDLGHEAVMTHLVGGDGMLPGLADSADAARRLIRHMLEPDRGAGLHVFVTHDSLVTATVARTLGRRLCKDDWPFYLEAAFFWREASGVGVAYRDHREVRP